MSDDDKKKPSLHGLWDHAPLPYIVTAKEIANQDAVPTFHKLFIVAYSILEAGMQANMEITGKAMMESERITIIKIEPDLIRYMQLVLSGQIPPVDTP